MRKFRLQISVLVLLLQGIIAATQGKYNLNVHCPDKDAALVVSTTWFTNKFFLPVYLYRIYQQLPGLFQSKGYVTASIDSIQYDTASARIVLFIGEMYLWARLDAKSIEPSLLEAVGWREKLFTDKPMDFAQVQLWQEKMLNHLENTGFPFARIYLDSLNWIRDKVSALLKVDKGPLYKIDSIRIYGNAKISNYYLQRYLDIPSGSIYSKEKLMRINKKIRELTYIEEEKPFDLTMLGTGSVLNMYLKQKKSSQVNVLIGFLPNNDQLSSKKLLLTGEANIFLKNALGSGETIGLNWQQIQVKSPRLNLLSASISF